MKRTLILAAVAGLTHAMSAQIADAVSGSSAGNGAQHFYDEIGTLRL